MNKCKKTINIIFNGPFDFNPNCIRLQKEIIEEIKQQDSSLKLAEIKNNQEELIDIHDRCSFMRIRCPRDDISMMKSAAFFQEIFRKKTIDHVIPMNKNLEVVLQDLQDISKENNVKFELSKEKFIILTGNRKTILRLRKIIKELTKDF